MSNLTTSVECVTEAATVITLLHNETEKEERGVVGEEE